MNCTGKNCIMQYDKVDPATCPCVPYCPQATPPKTNAQKFKEVFGDESMYTILSPNMQALIDWLDEPYKEPKHEAMR